MGHTRMTTQGSEKKNRNNYPFRGNAGGAAFALAHNGVLYNDAALRGKLHLPRTKIETDSYIAVQLIERQKALHLDSLAYMAEQVEGSFSFAVLDERDNLYFVKGDNPLCIYRYPKLGLLLYASTEGILRGALERLKFPLEQPEQLSLACGEIVQVDAGGSVSRGAFSVEHLMQMQKLYRRSPCYWGGWDLPDHAFPGEKPDSYIRELKSVASYFGYSPEDVDSLLVEGISTEELEEYFYCGEL